VLHRHRAIVRAQLAGLGGVEVDCCGDGFFAVFPVPALALRCAAGVAHALLAAGIEIRAGVHTGECDVEAGNSVSGIAVHVAARIASLARPREILVSDTVRDLVAGSGLAFADRGRRTLKGLAGSRRLFSLDAERACADAGAADESCTGASRHAANDERMTGRPGLQQLTDRSLRPSAS
jgi:class 3 adenylate cyclase